MYSRLYRLINDTVHPYIELEGVHLTKEGEKELLASLSQVLRQIQLWTRELEHHSDDELGTPSEDHHRLSSMIADLIFLLSIKSQYVRHSAGNIVVVISEFLATSGSNWDIFIQSLCLCMELAVTNALSFSSASSTAGLGNSHFDSSNFVVLIKPRLKNAGWSTLAEIVRVLRNIVKCLKQDYVYDDNLAKICLDSVHSCLSNVPWDSMDVIYSTQNSFTGDALIPRTDEEESRVVFLGNLVQLLCSMVEQSGSVNDAVHFLDKHPILFVITNLVPKLFYWCLSKQGKHVITCISQYFRHKLLVLLIRLSFLICLDCCILDSWLRLLHKYFQELLWQPITSVESVQDTSLEGSPFLLINSDGEVYNMSSHHLQRQAIFLFLRCSISLISLKEETQKRCACATDDSCSTFDLDLDCIGRKKGFLELYRWLQGHLPLDMFADYEIYAEKCMDFSLSFLQLFVHEDDLLFRVLLQLLSVPFRAEQRLDKRNWTSQDGKEDILFHLSYVFNAVHLFHLFLAELHYDHQVLLDYLISKDTGIDCAEYLLRCLRLVSNSWPLFMEFSLGGKVTNRLSDKRRKVVLESSHNQCRLPSTTMEKVPSFEKECENDLECGSKHYGARRSYYKDAKDCLLSLKISLENLHQKNLFLYNPEVLLKRLMRFQELCSQRDDCDNWKNGGLI
ncbi:Protein Lines [Melia azedarach]|nr:Protein Lines [Melia azedarach]